MSLPYKISPEKDGNWAIRELKATSGGSVRDPLVGSKRICESHKAAEATFWIDAKKTDGPTGSLQRLWCLGPKTSWSFSSDGDWLPCLFFVFQGLQVKNNYHLYHRMLLGTVKAFYVPLSMGLSRPGDPSQTQWGMSQCKVGDVLKLWTIFNDQSLIHVVFLWNIPDSVLFLK